jgi:hypothetical protein
MQRFPARMRAAAPLLEPLMRLAEIEARFLQSLALSVSSRADTPITPDVDRDRQPSAVDGRTGLVACAGAKTGTSLETESPHVEAATHCALMRALDVQSAATCRGQEVASQLLLHLIRYS